MEKKIGFSCTIHLLQFVFVLDGDECLRRISGEAARDLLIAHGLRRFGEFVKRKRRRE